jgi:hypothetical protein
MEIEILGVDEYFPTEQRDAALLALTLLGYTKIPSTQFVEGSSRSISPENFTISIGGRLFYRPLTQIDVEGARTGFLRVLELLKVKTDVKFYDGISEMPDSLTLDLVPAELYATIALNLSLKEIDHLCQTNRQFKENVCDDNVFWRRKFIQDYGPAPIIETDWKKVYREERQVVVFDRGHPNGFEIGIRAKKIRTGFDIYIIDSEDRLILKTHGNSYTKITDFKVLDMATAGMHDIYVITTDRKVAKITVSIKTRDYTISHFYNLPPAKNVYSSVHTHAVIDMQDNLWTFGRNMRGQLGIGFTGAGVEDPTQVGMKAKMVSIGSNHMAIIGLDDYVYICGAKEIFGLDQNQDRPYKTNIRAKMITSYVTCLGVIDMDNQLQLYGEHVFFKNLKIDGQFKFVSISNTKITLIDMDDNALVFGKDVDFTRQADSVMGSRSLGVKAYEITANAISYDLIRKSF